MSRWIRVTKRKRCPICEHADWCLISPDGAAVICMRVPSGREKRLKDGTIGNIHRIGDAKPEREYIPPTAAEVNLDVPAILRRYSMDTTPALMAEFAASLGVAASALERLGAVWSRRHNAWAFPMRDATGRAVGVRLRTIDGKKWAIRGSHSGLFLSATFEGDFFGGAGPIFVCEGPTDTAAMLTLGLDAIGRPSCSSCGDMVKTLLAEERREVVIVQDRDVPGQRGAAQLAIDLRRPCKIITPMKGKDAREWVKLGATRALVLAVCANIRNADVTRLRKFLEAR